MPHIVEKVKEDQKMWNTRRLCEIIQNASEVYVV